MQMHSNFPKNRNHERKTVRLFKTKKFVRKYYVYRIADNEIQSEIVYKTRVCI